MFLQDIEKLILGQMIQSKDLNKQNIGIESQVLRITMLILKLMQKKQVLKLRQLLKEMRTTAKLVI